MRLVAADSILIPMQCEYYALEGLAALLITIEQVKSSVNPVYIWKGFYALCMTRVIAYVPTSPNNYWSIFQ